MAHGAQMYGSDIPSAQPIADSSVEARIGSHIVPQANGCWLYNGNRQRQSIRVKGQVIRPYRFVYETLVGPIPEGLVLHHTCETPGCVNPAHLQAMTNGDHVSLHAAARCRVGG